MRFWSMRSVNSLTGIFISRTGWQFRPPRMAVSVSNSNPLGLDSNDPAARTISSCSENCTCRSIGRSLSSLSSKDVIHNFACPHMRMAQDAIPGQVIPMWFKPIKTGSYEVICGQLCGLGHYSMKGMLVVDTPADYQAWLKERRNFPARKAHRRPRPVRRANRQSVRLRGTSPPPGAPKTANPSGRVRRTLSRNPSGG